MPIKTDALILKENNNIGEADRFVTLLTRERGVVRASVRGARQIKSRHGAATRMLTYAQLTLIEGKSDLYVVTDAQAKRVFLEWDGIERLALAQYFCELCLALAPREAPAEEALRLMLNSLHFLADGKHDSRLIKALTELRLLCDAGYAPDLSACRRCGQSEGCFWLSPRAGTLTCAACGTADGVPLSAATTALLRRFATAPLEKCYGVKADAAVQAELSAACEAYLLAQVGRGFQTLDFYHTMET